jgi:hypothetical protein
MLFSRENQAYPQACRHLKAISSNPVAKDLAQGRSVREKPGGGAYIQGLQDRMAVPENGRLMQKEMGSRVEPG